MAVEGPGLDPLTTVIAAGRFLAGRLSTPDLNKQQKAEFFALGGSREWIKTGNKRVPEVRQYVWQGEIVSAEQALRIVRQSRKEPAAPVESRPAVDSPPSLPPLLPPIPTPATPPLVPAPISGPLPPSSPVDVLPPLPGRPIVPQLPTAARIAVRFTGALLRQILNPVSLILWPSVTSPADVIYPRVEATARPVQLPPPVSFPTPGPRTRGRVIPFPPGRRVRWPLAGGGTGERGRPYPVDAPVVIKPRVSGRVISEPTATVMPGAIPPTVLPPGLPGARSEPAPVISSSSRPAILSPSVVTARPIPLPTTAPAVAPLAIPDWVAALALPALAAIGLPASSSRTIPRQGSLVQPGTAPVAIPGTAPTVAAPAFPGVSPALPTVAPSIPATLPATLPTTFPGAFPLTALQASPVQSVRAAAQPVAQTQTDRCNCSRTKPKQKKKRKPREVCYRGTYTETATGTIKHRKEKISCQSSSKKSASPRPPKSITSSAVRRLSSRAVRSSSRSALPSLPPGLSASSRRALMSLSKNRRRR